MNPTGPLSLGDKLGITVLIVLSLFAFAAVVKVSVNTATLYWRNHPGIRDRCMFLGLLALGIFVCAHLLGADTRYFWHGLPAQ